MAKLDTLDDSLEGFEWIQYDEVNSWTFEYTIKNLKVGGMYSVRVAAENTVGRSAFTEISEPIIAKDMYCKYYNTLIFSLTKRLTDFLRTAPPGQPLPPIILSNVTRETADITWMAPKDQGGAAIESYFIEKRDLTTPHWIKVARVDADVRTLKIINLIEGHEYQIRISAENKFGKSLALESGKFKPLRAYGK